MIKTNDRIVVSIPYPIRVLGFRTFRKKQVGFLFTNLAVLLFRNNFDLKTSDDLNAWTKKNGQDELAFQTMYFAAIAYNMHMRQPDDFTEAGLRLAIKNTDEETLKKIGAVWESSELFGATYKKKVAVKKNR